MGDLGEKALRFVEQVMGRHAVPPAETESPTPVDGFPVQTPAPDANAVPFRSHKDGSPAPFEALPPIPRPIRAIVSPVDVGGVWAFFIETVDYDVSLGPYSSREDAVEGLKNHLREMFCDVVKGNLWVEPSYGDCPLTKSYNSIKGGEREWLTIRGLPERIELVIRYHAARPG